jgi:lipopolysaccharide transport system permease protein
MSEKPANTPAVNTAAATDTESGVLSLAQALQAETIISADQRVPGVLANLRKLYQYRELLFSLTARDIKIRYKQSALGIAWAILQPLALTVMFTILFSRIMEVEPEGHDYPIFVYCALLPWTFLSSQSLVANMNLVTKIYFPREVFPSAATAACFVDLLVGSTILTGMLFHYHYDLTINLLWLPAMLLIQIVLMLGIAFLASALNVFYRDIRHVIPVLVQLWMYASPIIYSESLVSKKYPSLYRLYMLNPMAAIITSYRRILLDGQPPEAAYVGIAAGAALLVFLLGYTYFKRAEVKFADLI